MHSAAQSALHGRWLRNARMLWLSVLTLGICWGTCGMFLVTRPPSLGQHHARLSEVVARRVVADGTASSDMQIVEIKMLKPWNGRIGVNIMGGTRRVSRVLHEDAFESGWRIGDTITEVCRQPVQNNQELKAAVKQALRQNEATGTVLHFAVRRSVKPPDTSRGMLRMTPGTGGDLTLPMKDLLRDLVYEFPVVVFLDGTLKRPNNNLSARAAEALQEAGIAFKAIDCTDEIYNPEVRAAVEELCGEYALPQLFAGGHALGNGYKIQELHKAGKLAAELKLVGAVPFTPSTT